MVDLHAEAKVVSDLLQMASCARALRLTCYDLLAVAPGVWSDVVSAAAELAKVTDLRLRFVRVEEAKTRSAPMASEQLLGFPAWSNVSVIGYVYVFNAWFAA